MTDDDEFKGKKKYLLYFSLMILFSGFFCFLLESAWVQRLNPFEKVPLYALIGISLNFCISFSQIDLINYIFSLFQKKWQKAMVESPIQVFYWLIGLGSFDSQRERFHGLFLWIPFRNV
jgi:hypothetical protein